MGVILSPHHQSRNEHPMSVFFFLVARRVWVCVGISFAVVIVCAFLAVLLAFPPIRKGTDFIVGHFDVCVCWKEREEQSGKVMLAFFIPSVFCFRTHTHRTICEPSCIQLSLNIIHSNSTQDASMRERIVLFVCVSSPLFL